MRNSFNRYATIFGTVTAAGLAAVAALNALIDPIGAYPMASLTVMGSYRSQSVSRPAKAEMLLRSKCDVLLLGSSRVQTGIPVDHPEYQTKRVHNLGLAATSLPEIFAVMRYALKHQKPKLILFGADFFLFSDVRSSDASFEGSRFNPQFQSIEYHFKNLFGAQMTQESWSLLRQWLRNEPPMEVVRGFVPRSVPAGISQHESFERGIRRFLRSPEVYGAYHYSPERLDLFRQMVRSCRSAGVNLVVFVPPVHVLELETVRAAGLWHTFERWKTDLTRILSEEGPNESVPFWDFTGFTGPVSEKVPPPGDTSTRMHGYLENSHFTPEIGNIVLKCLLADSTLAGNACSLGQRLTTNSIAAHLEQQRRDREAYASVNSAEVQWVNRLAANAKGVTFDSATPRDRENPGGL